MLKKVLPRTLVPIFDRGALLSPSMDLELGNEERTPRVIRVPAGLRAHVAHVGDIVAVSDGYSELEALSAASELILSERNDSVSGSVDIERGFEPAVVSKNRAPYRSRGGVRAALKVFLEQALHLPRSFNQM